MLNPYVIIGLLVGWGASLAGAFWFGTSYETGQEAKRTALIKDATAAVVKANQQFTDTIGLKIAQGFQGIKIVNTQITNEVRHEREIQTRILDNPVCDLPRTTWSLLNRARGYGEDGSSTGGASDPMREASPPAIPAPGR